MSITPRSRFLDLETIRERFDRLFSDLTSSAGISEERSMLPIDIQETDHEVVVKASVPGVKPEDINVEVHHGMLSIRGESSEHRDEALGKWHVVERRVGSFSRMVTLPSPVDESSADATYEDGVLTVTFQKTLEQVGKKIEIKSTHDALG